MFSLMALDIGPWTSGEIHRCNASEADRTVWPVIHASAIKGPMHLWESPSRQIWEPQGVLTAQSWYEGASHRKQREWVVIKKGISVCKCAL